MPKNILKYYARYEERGKSPSSPFLSPLPFFLPSSLPFPPLFPLPFLLPPFFHLYHSSLSLSSFLLSSFLLSFPTPDFTFKLGIVIVPISFSLLLRCGIAWAVALKGNTFLNFYVWILLFWMLPELFPVTIMLIAVSLPISKNEKTSDMRTPSTIHLQDSSAHSSNRVRTISSSSSIMV